MSSPRLSAPWYAPVCTRVACTSDSTRTLTAPPASAPGFQNSRQVNPHTGYMSRWLKSKHDARWKEAAAMQTMPSYAQKNRRRPCQGRRGAIAKEQSSSVRLQGQICTNKPDLKSIPEARVTVKEEKEEAAEEGRIIMVMYCLWHNDVTLTAVPDAS